MNKLKHVPTRLKLVACIFIVGGTITVLKDVILSVTTRIFWLSPGLIPIVIGIGLFTLKPVWRYFGLALAALGVVVTPVCFVYVLISKQYQGLISFALTRFLILGALSFSLCLWQFLVLRRQDIRDLFASPDHTPPKKIFITAVCTFVVLLLFFHSYRQKSNAQSERWFQKLDSHLARGSEFLAQEDYEAAAHEFRQALKHYPDWDTAQHNLNVALRRGAPITLDDDPKDPNMGIYVVQTDDDLLVIATMWGTTVEELKKINDLTNDKLKLGQQLKIPKP